MPTLHSGDHAWWIDDDHRGVRIRIALVTAYRVYVEATGAQSGPNGQRVWYETHASARRRIADRKTAYVRGARVWHDPDSTAFAIDEKGLHP
jgi:hypothetical protein